MVFGFPAYHMEDFFPQDRDHDLQAAVREALAQLSWRIKREEQNLIVASTKIGLLSWGERVHLQFHPDNSLTIRSECVLPTQCIDWGTNKRNVRKFIKELDGGAAELE